MLQQMFEVTAARFHAVNADVWGTGRQRRRRYSAAGNAAHAR